MTGLVHAIKCYGEGTMCEQKELHITKRGTRGMTAPPTAWYGPASDAGTRVNCPKSQVINSMKCKPPGCGKIFVECGSLESDIYNINEEKISFSNTFSVRWPHKAIGTCPDGILRKRHRMPSGRLRCFDDKMY